MIGKQEKGRSFRGCLKYVLEKPGAELIGGNMVGETVDELASEFNVARRLNPNLEVVVYHAMLAVSAEERQISSQWLEIAQKYLEGMGFSGCQFVAVRHTDEAHDHIHIVACRVRLPDAKTVSDSNDYRRSEDVIRELEQIYGLESVTPSYEQVERSPTTGEVRRFEKQQQQFDQDIRAVPPDPPLRMVLQALIVNLSQHQPSLPELIQQLQDRGVEVGVKLTERQEWGISYGLNGEYYSGTQLGRAYTFKGLQNWTVRSS
jgi:hypothetical protein